MKTELGLPHPSTTEIKRLIHEVLGFVSYLLFLVYHQWCY